MRACGRTCAERVYASCTRGFGGDDGCDCIGGSRLAIALRGMEGSVTTMIVSGYRVEQLMHWRGTRLCGW